MKRWTLPDRFSGTGGCHEGCVCDDWVERGGRNRDAEGEREAGKERARRLWWRCIARARMREGADLEGGQGMWCRWVDVELITVLGRVRFWSRYSWVVLLR